MENGLLKLGLAIGGVYVLVKLLWKSEEDPAQQIDEMLVAGVERGEKLDELRQLLDENDKLAQELEDAINADDLSAIDEYERKEVMINARLAELGV